MFALDEMAKPYLLSKLTPGTTMHTLANHYWDQMVLYLLVAPFQWLHLGHLLFNTTWMQYSVVGKVLLVVYIVLILSLWEVIRVFIFLLCKNCSSVEDLQAIASHVAVAASDLSKKAYERAGPMMVTLKDSAVDLYQKTAVHAGPVMADLKKSAEHLYQKTAEKAAPVMAELKKSAEDLYHKTADRVQATASQLMAAARNRFGQGGAQQAGGTHQAETSNATGRSNKSKLSGGSAKY